MSIYDGLTVARKRKLVFHTKRISALASLYDQIRATVIETEGKCQLYISEGLQSVKQFFMDIIKATVGHHQHQVAGGGMPDKKFNDGSGICEKMGILTAAP